MNVTAFVDNSGRIHISDGMTAWAMAPDYNIRELYFDMEAWSEDDWSPSEDAGDTQESLEEYEEQCSRPDSTPLRFI